MQGNASTASSTAAAIDRRSFSELIRHPLEKVPLLGSKRRATGGRAQAVDLYRTGGARPACDLSGDRGRTLADPGRAGGSSALVGEVRREVLAKRHLPRRFQARLRLERGF